MPDKKLSEETNQITMLSATDRIRVVNGMGGTPATGFIEMMQLSPFIPGLTNTETISATRALVDADLPVQRLTPSGAKRTVTLPAAAATNHPFYIINASTDYSLVIDALGVIGPGQSGMLVSDGTAYTLLAPLINNTVIQSVTTANVSALSGKSYFLDLSGLTANRNFVVPAGAVGDEILVNVTIGASVHALIIIGASGVTINGGSAATEWSRLFIANESVRLVATSSTGWRIVNDGRLPCISVFERTTSAANTTHTPDTDTKADWNSLPKNVGSCGDTTNDRFTVRRTGTYEASGGYAPAAAITDQKWVNVKVKKNGSTRINNASQRQSAVTSSSIAGVAITPKPVDLAVGDYLEYFFNTEEANIGLLNTDFAGGGANQLGTVTFFAVKEILR